MPHLHEMKYAQTPQTIPVVNGSYWTNLGLKNHLKILTSIRSLL